jgi:hypothetical protein
MTNFQVFEGAIQTAHQTIQLDQTFMIFCKSCLGAMPLPARHWKITNLTRHSDWILTLAVRLRTLNYITKDGATQDLPVRATLSRI